MKGKTAAPKTSLRPKSRDDVVIEETLMRGEAESERDAMDLMDAMLNSMSKKSYGKVKGYKGGGCVMAGRGGSFKGMK